MALNAGNPDQFIDIQMDQATLIANTGFALNSPMDGYIKELRTAVQTAVTTGGTLTVWINGVQVTGLSLAVPSAAAKNTRQGPATPNKQSQNRAVVKGDLIEVRTSGFATAGALNAFLTLSVADTDGVMPF